MNTRLVAVAAVGVIAVTAVVLVVFEPQSLFFDDVVDEAFPVTAASRAPDEPASTPDDAPLVDAPAEGTETDTGAPSDGVAAPDPATPVVLRSGSFISRDHPTQGMATIYEVDGERVLRFEGFATDNGPDLRVGLTATAADGPADTIEDVYLELGELKGNIGDQNYVIPEGIDLDRFASVVIWCDRFNVTFGGADLA